jgi:hypothetical protein
MRSITTTLLLLGVFVLLGGLVIACGSAVTDEQAACDRAFAQAEGIDPASDTVSDIDGTIAGCQSLEAWVAAAQRHPAALAGQDPATVAAGRCATSAGLANAQVCIDLQGH